MSAGADGYMLKEDSDSELLAAIRKVLADEVYISPFFSEEMSEEVLISYLNKDRRPPCETLTTRERQVLKLVAEGETSKDIATKLSISTRTVEHHRANLMKKLNLKNAADLIRYAINKGYVTPTN